MYTAFYELYERPFQICTDPKYLWLGEDYKEALSALKYGVMSDNGFLLLTGDVGTGKTTLLNAWLRDLDDSVRVAHVTDPDLDLMGFFNLVGQSVDIARQFSKKEDFLLSFKEFLFKTGTQTDTRLLLVIDEAQKLSIELLEQIRLLSNIEFPEKKLINIFLVGQNELNEMLLTRPCRALRQRITLNYNIKPLSEENTRHYIAHRLKVAGLDKKIFTGGSLHEIYHLSRGYPRLINIICDQALLIGYSKSEKIITPQIVSECGRSILLPGETLKDFFPAPHVRSAEVPPSPAAERSCDERRSFFDGLAEGFRRAKSIIRWENLARWRSGAWAGDLSRRLRSIHPLFLIGLTAVCFWLIFGYVFSGPEKPAADALNQTSSRQGDASPALSTAAESSMEASDSVTLDKSAPVKALSVEENAIKNPPQGNVTTAGPIGTATPDGKGEVAASATPEPVAAEMSELAQAKQYLAQKQYVPAIGLLSGLANSDGPESVEIKNMYARALLGKAQLVKAQDRPEAEELLQKAIDFNPMLFEAYYELGKLYAAEKKYSQSVLYYTRAETLQPDSVKVLFDLGFSYAAMKAYPEAEKKFARVTELNPSYLDKALVNLAIVQLKQGKTEAGRENLQRALSVNSGNQKAIQYLEQIQASSGGSL